MIDDYLFIYKELFHFIWSINHHLAVIFYCSRWKYLYIALEILKCLTCFCNHICIYKMKELQNEEILFNQLLDPRVFFTDGHNLKFIILIPKHVILCLQFKAIQNAFHYALVSLYVLISQLFNQVIRFFCFLVQHYNFLGSKLGHFFLLFELNSFEVLDFLFAFDELRYNLNNFSVWTKCHFCDLLLLFLHLFFVDLLFNVFNVYVHGLLSHNLTVNNLLVLVDNLVLDLVFELVLQVLLVLVLLILKNLPGFLVGQCVIHFFFKSFFFFVILSCCFFLLCHHVFLMFELKNFEKSPETSLKLLFLKV